jgi:hypothetical protein
MRWSACPTAWRMIIRCRFELLPPKFAVDPSTRVWLREFLGGNANVKKTEASKEGKEEFKAEQGCGTA